MCISPSNKRRFSLTVITPALNEEENLRKAVLSIIKDLEFLGIDWEIIIVDDGSTDSTGEIADRLSCEYSKIRVIHHKRPMGVGKSFKDGLTLATKEAVTYIPGDGENDPFEIIKYIDLLNFVDIINPFVINKYVRPKYRRVISAIYLWIINITFGTTFSYTNGNVIYKKKIFKKIHCEANSFFFQTELLLKSCKAGFLYAEVPIRIKQREKGSSKALTFKSLRTLCKEYIKLFLTINFGSFTYRL